MSQLCSVTHISYTYIHHVKCYATSLHVHPCSLTAGHSEKDVKAAHLFLHRLLYRINRMNLFWCEIATDRIPTSVHLCGLQTRSCCEPHSDTVSSPALLLMRVSHSVH